MRVTPEERSRISLLGRLYANMMRRTTLYEESAQQSDTLHWSKARTLQESIRTFEGIMLQRNELAKQPAQPLVHELQVQQLFDYSSYSRREFAGAYQVYMEMMLDIYRAAHTLNDPVAAGEKRRYEERILQEIRTSREEGFVKESVGMLLSYAKTKGEAQAECYRTQRKLYEKYDEVVLLDLALYKSSILPQWQREVEKFSDTAQRSESKEMQRIEATLAQQWTQLSTRAKGTPYAKMVEKERKVLLPQKISIDLKMKDVTTGTIEVSTTFVVREPVSIDLCADERQKNSKIKTIDTLTPQKGRALIGRKTYVDTLPKPGHYRYKAVQTADKLVLPYPQEISYSKIGTEVFRTEDEVMIRTYDLKTGAPLPGLKWWITDGPPPMGKAYTTDEDGIAHIPRSSAVQRLRLRDPRLAAAEETVWVDQRARAGKKVADKDPIQLYFDRPIYRYGQAVRIGIVSKAPGPKGTLPAPNQSGRIALKARRQEKEELIATQTYRTNKQAVAQTTFHLPTDEELTDFYIAYGDNLALRQPLEVESYKLHHLNVKLDSIPSGIVAGAPAVIYGTTTDMSGNLTPAEVEVSVRDQDAVRSYRVSSAGVFRCDIDSLQRPSGHMTENSVKITVQATDALGQVAQTHLYAIKSESALPLSADDLIGGTDIPKEKISVKTAGQPYHRNLPTNLSEQTIRLELKGSKGKQIPLGSIPADGNATWERSDIPSGEYTLIAYGRDKQGRESRQESSPFYLYSLSDKRLHAERVAWLVAPKDTIAEDEELTLLIGSSYETNMWLQITSTEEERTESYSRIIPLKNEIRKVTLPASEIGKGDLSVTVLGVHNGVTKSVSTRIVRSKKLKQIVAEAPGMDKQSFQPGEHLEKELIIRDEKGNPLPNVQAIVTIYDKALDDAATWQLKWRPIKQWDYELSLFGSRYDYAKGGGVQMMRTASVALAKESISLAEDLASSNGTAPEKQIVLRKDFHETAYFNALLRTDNDGRVRLSFTLPDTQTKYVTRVFMFTSELERQRIQEFSFDVKEPLSIELGLPRYLLQGDSLEAEAVIRNLTSGNQSVEYTLTSPPEVLSQGRSMIPAGKVGTIPFHFVAPASPVDTLSFEARVRSLEYGDGIRRKIPLHSSLSTYPIAIPLSLYKASEATLVLPKADHLQDLPVLSLYCDPFSLVLSGIAGNHAALEDIPAMDLFESLHRYVVYSQMLHFMDHHPAVVSNLRRALPLLETACGQSSSDHKLEGDDGSARMQRISAPRRLATLYRLLTDKSALTTYVSALEKQLQTHREPGGGWSYHRGYPSPWITLYVLGGLTHIPAQYLSDRWSPSISRALTFIEDNYHSWYRLPLLHYAVIRAKLGHKTSPLPIQMRKDLEQESLAARQEYRNRSSYALIPYAEYVHFYENAEAERAILSFMRERSGFTRSDREKLSLKLFLSKDEKDVAPELIEFMLTHKQGTLWHSPYTLEATKVLLAHLSPTEYSETLALEINGHRHLLSPLERATGVIHRALSGSHSETLALSIRGIRSDYIFGGLLYHVSEPNAEVTPTGNSLKVSKEIFVRRLLSSSHTSELVRVTSKTPARKGERLVVRYTIESDRDLSLLWMDDPRPAGAEPGYDFQGYRYDDNLFWVYRRLWLKDRIYIDYLPRGRHVLEMDATASSSGVYSYGPAVITSYFAPEFVGNSAGGKITIKP